MNDLIGGFRLTQLVHAAAKLGIADELKDGPRTVQELAASTKSHADSLYRLLRTLASLGVFAEEEGMRFRLTPAGELLRSGVPGSVRTSAIVRGEDWNRQPWGHLLHSVKTGENAFEHVYGKNPFDWFKEHEDAARMFDDLMAEMTRRSASAVVKSYDFSAAKTVVDIGGGSGVLLSEILRSNAALRGVLFDLDHVAAAARAAADPAIAARCEYTGGDFFRGIPRGGDLYVLKYIIHDWDDERSRAILSNCRTAMNGKGKLLLVEDLVCGANQRCNAKIADIQMLVITGGRNRTETEYRSLLTASGFRVARTLPVMDDLHILEAIPAG